MHFQKKSLAVAVSLAIAPLAALAAPTISWVAPSSGANLYGAYSESRVGCEVSGSGISRVKYYVDTREVNTDNGAPYRCVFDTRTFSTGTKTLKALAIGSDGTTTSITRSVNFTSSSTGTTTTPSNVAPSVTLTAPTSGQTVSGTVALSAIAADDKAVSRVVFSVDSTTLATDTASPFSASLNTTTLANGTHTLKAQAFDAEGLSATSQVSINVQNTTSSTTTTTTSTPPPGSGSLDVWFKAPLASNTVSGVLSGTKCYVNGTGVTKVAFKLDSTALNTDTVMADGMQCVLDTTKFANGTHTLTATATSSTGATRSDVISINVQNSATTSTTNAAPSVSISSPASGATVAGTVAYAASAADDKAVARVVFSLDSTTLATLTAAPYGGSLNTTTLGNGSHTLKAVAFDAEGLSSTSQISLNVQNGTSSSGGSMPTDSTNVRGVPTFQSIGMYWTSPGATSSGGCKMQFRKQGDSAWRDALDMWFDSRNSECRGSIVMLQPGTQYEVQMGLPGQAFKKGLAVATWNEQFPIAQTITLPATSSSQLTISSGGTPSGYVLYQAAPGGSTIDVANAKQYNVLVSAPYVIVRGLTLKNAQIDGIRILPGAHHVVIEDNDISGWGRSGGWTTAAGWQVGMDRESGIRCMNAPAFEGGVIQRNKIHDPRYGANSWDWGHPLGPQGITFSYCGGNHVIRYNEIYSTKGQQYWYNDGISGEDNFSSAGFPNYDTDIYGNRISETWDDAIEAEGGGRNVRVFGNYTNNTNTGVASTVVDKGPLYVFRNVHNRSRAFSQRSLDSDDRNNAYKSGEAGGYGGGRRYMLHNTLLQATQSGAVNGLGMGGGIAGNTNQPLTNTVSRNNILHVWKTNAYSVYSAGGSGNDVNYDLRNGAVNISGGELNGLVGMPTYASGNGWQNESGGNYRLSSSSLGYGKALRLPNFNDAYSAPDVGAHQSGLPAMSFGVSGDSNFWVSGAPVGSATTSTASTSTSTTTTSTTTSTSTAVLGPVVVPQ